MLIEFRPATSRYAEGALHRRPYGLHDRGGKTTRSLVHRSSRLSMNPKGNSPQKGEGEFRGTSSSTAAKKDQHRHSLDGYDLNNVAGNHRSMTLVSSMKSLLGVVKIETLPAGALEEENSAFDDDGEEFCLVMSKRNRKEQKAAQLSKQNAIEITHTGSHSSNSTEPTSKSALNSVSVDNDEQPTTEVNQVFDCLWSSRHFFSLSEEVFE